MAITYILTAVDSSIGKRELTTKVSLKENKRGVKKTVDVEVQLRDLVIIYIRD